MLQDDLTRALLRTFYDYGHPPNTPRVILDLESDLSVAVHCLPRLSRDVKVVVGAREEGSKSGTWSDTSCPREVSLATWQQLWPCRAEFVTTLQGLGTEHWASRPLTLQTRGAPKFPKRRFALQGHCDLVLSRGVPEFDEGGEGLGHFLGQVVRVLSRPHGRWICLHPTDPDNLVLAAEQVGLTLVPECADEDDGEETTEGDDEWFEWERVDDEEPPSCMVFQVSSF